MNVPGRRRCGVDGICMFRWARGKLPGAMNPGLTYSSSTLHMRALEPRVLLDAASTETVMDAVGDAVHASLADAYLEINSPNPSGDSAQTTGVEALFEDEKTDLDALPGVEIAFVAGDVPDIATLLEGLPDGLEVVVLNAEDDGLLTIAKTLKDRSDIDAVHLITHGEQGVLQLGMWLNLGFLSFQY